MRLSLLEKVIRKFVQASLIEQKQLLTCGGAAGHLSHVMEDLSLTFGEVKEIILSADKGELENVTEKLDGINLVFTYDIRGSELKVARSGGDIKRGGMDAITLSKKFFGRGNLEDAFNITFKVLEEATSSLPIEALTVIFGDEGTKWYSIEIIYSETPNTINYDGSHIVFHGWPIFELTADGQIEQAESDEGVKILSSRVEQMQKQITRKDWNLKGPSIVNLKKIIDGSAAEKCISKIDAAMGRANVSDSDTMYDYLRNLIRVSAEGLELDEEVIDAIVDRSVSYPGAPGLPAIKKLVPKEKQAQVTSFVKNAEIEVKVLMRPLEEAFNEFAVELLRGIDSTLISDNQKEIARLKADVQRAISIIENSGHEQAIEVLQKELARLGSVENITSAMEGIVFFVKGKAFKITGPFAAFHQILSLFKYGRKGIPPFSMSEQVLRETIRQLIKEGGQAFDRADSISLKDYEVIWPRLESTLKSFGCKKIEPVGSTGKKHIMGDLDIAVEFDGTREELFDNIVNKFGQDSATKVGGTIVSFVYPYEKLSGEESYVQVDLMVGNVNYLSWARAGTSNVEGHEDYSPIKGVFRNLLFATINRLAGPALFKDKEHSETDRTKYNVDFDKGLFRVSQTKRNKVEGKPNLKSWRTIESKLVSDNPNEIVKIIFGNNFSSKDIRTLENTIRAIKTSSKLENISSEILSEFLIDVENFVEKNQKLFDNETENILSYISKLIK